MVIKIEDMNRQRLLATEINCAVIRSVAATGGRSA
jgi:hypothetical protein